MLPLLLLVLFNYLDYLYWDERKKKNGRPDRCPRRSNADVPIVIQLRLSRERKDCSRSCAFPAVYDTIRWTHHGRWHTLWWYRNYILYVMFGSLYSYKRISFEKIWRERKDGRSIHAAKKEVAFFSFTIWSASFRLVSWEIKTKKDEKGTTKLYTYTCDKSGRLVECRRNILSRLCDYFGNFLGWAVQYNISFNL